MIRALCVALLLAGSAPADAQTFAIAGGMLATGNGDEPAAGTVVIRNGRIIAAGPGVSIPAGAEIIDATGKWVTPGIVAGFSRLGLAEVDLSAGGAEEGAGASDTAGAYDDTSSNGPFSAALDVVPAINPLDTTIAVNRADGVVRALVAPGAGKSIFAGQGAVIDTGADMDPITAARKFQFVELGDTGAGIAGGSRASSHILFRNALREAGQLRRYAPVAGRRGDLSVEHGPAIVRDPNESRMYGVDARRSDDVLLTRFDAAALVPVLQGRQYLLVHVERASDIIQVLQLKREFPALKLVLVGASEGWLVADRIAGSGIPVIASAVNDLPASFEQLAATQSNIGRMRAAGIDVSIGMIDDNDTRNLFMERQYAGNLVALQKIPGATGVRWGEALAMITSKPAQAIGMGNEIGSLAPGRRADVVIWSGDPLEGSSAAEQVFIDGVRQPLVTHQTRLLDRYRYLPRRDLPEAYRH